MPEKSSRKSVKQCKATKDKRPGKTKAASKKKPPLILAPKKEKRRSRRSRTYSSSSESNSSSRSSSSSSSNSSSSDSSCSSTGSSSHSRSSNYLSRSRGCSSCNLCRNTPNKYSSKKKGRGFEGIHDWKDSRSSSSSYDDSSSCSDDTSASGSQDDRRGFRGYGRKFIKSRTSKLNKFIRRRNQTAGRSSRSRSSSRSKLSSYDNGSSSSDTDEIENSDIERRKKRKKNWVQTTSNYDGRQFFGACYRCQEVGHRAARCPHMVCFKCKQKGHRFVECPMAAVPPLQCQVCGCKGVTFQNCQNCLPMRQMLGNGQAGTSQGPMSPASFQPQAPMKKIKLPVRQFLFKKVRQFWEGEVVAIGH